MLFETLLQCIALMLFILAIFLGIVFLFSMAESLYREVRRRLIGNGKKRKRKKKVQSYVHKVRKR